MQSIKSKSVCVDIQVQLQQTWEESSMALWRFRNFRWQAARFEYSAGIFLLSLMPRLYAFTALW